MNERIKLRPRVRSECTTTAISAFSCERDKRETTARPKSSATVFSFHTRDSSSAAVQIIVGMSPACNHDDDQAFLPTSAPPSVTITRVDPYATRRGVFPL